MWWGRIAPIVSMLFLLALFAIQLLPFVVDEHNLLALIANFPSGEHSS